MLHDSLGIAPEEQTFQAGMAMSGDNNEIGPHLAREATNLVEGATDPSVNHGIRGPDCRGFQPLLERALDLRVGGEEISAGNREINFSDMKDVQRGPKLFRERGRVPQRLCGFGGEIRRSEHRRDSATLGGSGRSRLGHERLNYFDAAPPDSAA